MKMSLKLHILISIANSFIQNSLSFPVSQTSFAIRKAISTASANEFRRTTLDHVSPSLLLLKLSKKSASSTLSIKESEEDGAETSTTTSAAPPKPTWEARQKGWRPTIQDVENISWGKPAKKKGTGSRGTPHRLNLSTERQAFDQGRRKGFLEVVGSGWRSQRSDAPLVNSYRSLCDARGVACVMVHKGNTGLDDEVVLDMSPLRLQDDFKRIETNLLEYIGIPCTSTFSNLKENEEEENEYDDETSTPEFEIETEDMEEAWKNRPIYQLPPTCITWELPRSEAKALGKTLAGIFETAEPKATKSKKPKGVKHGKGRRSGGYGIG